MAEEKKDPTKLVEKKPTYNAKYPYNQVTMNSNGLMVEMDDTLGNVRYHIYHPIGSFYEMQQDGDVILKTAKDLDFIVGGNKDLKPGNLRTQITGNSDATIGANSSRKVTGNLVDVVVGNVEEFHLKEKVLKVGKNFKTFVGNTYTIAVSKVFNLVGKVVNITSGEMTAPPSEPGTINIMSSNSIKNESKGSFYVTAGTFVDINAKEKCDITTPTLNITAFTSIQNDVNINGKLTVSGGISVG